MLAQKAFSGQSNYFKLFFFGHRLANGGTKKSFSTHTHTLKINFWKGASILALANVERWNGMFLTKKQNPKDSCWRIKERKLQERISEVRSICRKNTFKEKGTYKSYETRRDSPGSTIYEEALKDWGVDGVLHSDWGTEIDGPLGSSNRSMVFKCMIMCRPYTKINSNSSEVSSPIQIPAVKKPAQSLA